LPKPVLEALQAHLNGRDEGYVFEGSSLEITKVHEPYIGPTSGYSGPGKGAKPGFEEQNNLSETTAEEG
jgi:hypothetical protein